MMRKRVEKLCSGNTPVAARGSGERGKKYPKRSVSTLCYELIADFIGERRECERGRMCGARVRESNSFRIYAQGKSGLIRIRRLFPWA